MAVSPRGSKFIARPFLNGKHTYLGAFVTEEEAQRVHDEALEKGKVTGLETVEEFATRWAADYPRPKASTQTNNVQGAKQVAANRTVLRAGSALVILPRLRMREVTRPIARAFAREHPNLLRYARAMFSDAYNDGIVESNPFSKLGMKQSRGRRDISPLTEEEVQAIAEISHTQHGAYGPTFAALWLMAAYTGMRPGELFGLEWRDVDRERGEIHVRRRLYEKAADVPKNSQTRTIVLPDQAAVALADVPRFTHSVRLPNGDPLDLVFRSKEGKPYGKSTLYFYFDPVRRAFEATLDEARRRELAENRPARRKDGYRPLEFYEARHFCATFLLELGLSAEDVGVEQLGHADGVLVSRLYGHPSKELARDRIRAAMKPRVRTLKVVGEREAENG
jgi:integrase